MMHVLEMLIRSTVEYCQKITFCTSCCVATVYRWSIQICNLVLIFLNPQDVVYSTKVIKMLLIFYTVMSEIKLQHFRYTIDLE